MRSVTLLCLSLAANAAFGILVVQRLSTGNSATPRNNLSLVAPPPLTDTQRWQKISSTEVETDYIAELRSAGFPPEVIRALLVERLTARYAPRLKALKQKRPKVPYWQNGSWYDSEMDLASRAELRAIHREIADTVDALLGDNPESHSAFERDRRARNYGNLPNAKVTEIEAINRDYGEIAAQVRSETKGVILAADREKLILIAAEKRADITRLLAPEELAAYDARNSPSALEVRSKLRYFDATESEFLTLYQLQRDFDTRYGRDNLSGEQSDRRKTALPELNQQIASALGPERFANFEILTDGNYFATRSTLTELGLPPDSATALVRIQRNAIGRADAIQADATLNADQRNAQLAALATEAIDRIAATLGSPENIASYKRYGAGQWLNRLNPPEKSGAKP